MAFSGADLAAAVQAAVGGGTFIMSSLINTAEFYAEIKDEFDNFNSAQRVAAAIMVADFKMKGAKFEQEDDGSNQTRAEMAEMFAEVSYAYGNFDENFAEVFDPTKAGATAKDAVALCFPNGCQADVDAYVKKNGTTPNGIIMYIGNHLSVVCKMGEGSGHWAAKFTKLFNSRLGEMTLMGKRERELTFTLMQRNYATCPDPGDGEEDHIIAEMKTFKDVLAAVDNVLAQQVSRIAGIGNTAHELIYTTMSNAADFNWKEVLEGNTLCSKKLLEEYGKLRDWKVKFDANPWIIFKGGAGPGATLKLLVALCVRIQTTVFHNNTWAKFKGGSAGEFDDQIQKWVDQYAERGTEDLVDLPPAPAPDAVLVLDGIKYTAPTI